MTLQTLEKVLGDFAQKHPYLTIKYERSEERDCFLVNVLYSVVLQDFDPFYTDLLELIYHCEDTFGVGAVLFTENSDLFSLSTDAETILSLDEDSKLSSSYAVNSPIEKCRENLYRFGGRDVPDNRGVYTDFIYSISNEAA